ncbi:DUF2914 domain-containing protein [Candidatus Margulisiibacteriota bacterium]
MRKTNLVGYSFTKPNKRRRILAVLFLLGAVALLLFLFIMTPEQEKIASRESITTTTRKKIIESLEEPVLIQPGEVKVLKKITCAKIEARELQGIASVFPPEGQVYFYTSIMAQEVPLIIKHVWVKPDGQSYAAVDLSIIRHPQDTWSYITLPPGSEGQWLVRVVVGDKIVDELRFKVE